MLQYPDSYALKSELSCFKIWTKIRISKHKNLYLKAQKSGYQSKPDIEASGYPNMKFHALKSGYSGTS